MKNLNAVLIVLTVAASIIVTGCSGVRYPKYYALELPAPPDPPTAPEKRASIAVREFKSPQYLRQGPLVYRNSPEEIGFYYYQRWATDPREVVTDAIIDRLRASGKFAEVEVYDGRSNTDYVLSGRLERLEEVDHAGGINAEVALSAQMTDVHTGATVWANNSSETASVSQHNMQAVVGEMSHSMDVAIEKLLSSLPSTPPQTSR